MLKKILNVRLVQTRLGSLNTPLQSSGIYHKTLFKFSESNENQGESDKTQKHEKNRDGEKSDKKDKSVKGKHDKKQGGQSKDFSPQVMEPGKKKEGHHKGKDGHKGKDKDKQQSQQKEATPSAEQGAKTTEAPQKRQFFQFGAKRQEKIEKKEEEEEDERRQRTPAFDFLSEKSKQRQPQRHQQRTEEGREERESETSDSKKQREDETAADRREQRRPKTLRIFGRKELGSGFLLNKMGIELKGESDHAPAELTPENRNTISARINSLRQLENTPKKYEALLELYLILEEPENAQQAYLEAQELNISKTVVIENFMFDACLKESYVKAKDFYLYMKDNNKLEQIFIANMNNFIESQVANEHFEELANTLTDLKLVNFNLGSLDISIFNDFFGFGAITNKSQYNANISTRKESVFLRKAEIFVDYLREILRRKPSQIESFAYLFKFKIFFGILNDLHYPKIKLDSNGLDISMNFLEVLAESSLITPKYVEFEDLARWVAPYFQLPDSLRRIHDITKGIPNDVEFFPYFLKEFNNYVALQGEAPFDSQTVRDLYAFLKEELDKSKRTINIETLRLILEVAQAHKQYDIIFDAYENYSRLVNSKESPLFLYIYLTNAFTHLNLSTKNCYQIVNNLTEEYSTQYNEFPKTLDVVLKTKALIKDGKYEEAHALFNGDILRNLIPGFQKTYLFSVLAVTFLPFTEPQKRKDKEEYTDTLNKIKNFVNGLSDSDYQEIFSKLQNNNVFVQEITGTTDIDAHIKKWQAVADDPREHLENVNEWKRRCAREVEKIIQQKLRELRARRYRSEIEQTEVEQDEEARKILYQSSWKEVDIEPANLNKNDIISLMARIHESEYDMRKLIRLPESKTYRKSLTLTSSKEEYNRPTIDLVNDLIIWGVYNNEPLAVRLGEEFYHVVGERMSPYLTGKLQLFYKYQLTGELEGEENSFKYTQENTRNVPKTFLDANSPYSVIEDDVVYDAYLAGLEKSQKNKPLFESLVRKQPLLKKELLKQEEPFEKIKRPGKVNFIN